MELNIVEYNVRIVVVVPQDRMDAFVAPSLRQQLYELVATGISHFVLDLSHVLFMDSAGLAVLVSLLKRTRQAGGDTILVWPQEPGGQRILELTKFSRVFYTAATVESALECFGVQGQGLSKCKLTASPTDNFAVSI